MNIQLKYKDVKHIIDSTDWLSGAFDKKDQPNINTSIGYFTPASSNWSYRVGISRGNDNQPYIVVTVYGGIKGFIPVFI